MLLINIALVPIQIGLAMFRNYLGRSRKLAPVGYIANIVLISLMLLLMIINGIQLEPLANYLDRWGSMVVWTLIWEILVFDSIRAFITLHSYRNIIENGESALESLID